MRIEEVEGIGPTYGQKLAAAGVATTDELLAQGAKPGGRDKLAEVTGISGKLILEWVNHADLMRLDGVGRSTPTCSRPPASTRRLSWPNATRPTWRSRSRKSSPPGRGSSGGRRPKTRSRIGWPRPGSCRRSSSTDRRPPDRRGPETTRAGPPPGSFRLGVGDQLPAVRRYEPRTRVIVVTDRSSSRAATIAGRRPVGVEVDPEDVLPGALAARSRLDRAHVEAVLGEDGQDAEERARLVADGQHDGRPHRLGRRATSRGRTAPGRATTRNRVRLSATSWMSSARTSSPNRAAARGDRTAAAPRSARSTMSRPAPAVL